MRSHIHTLAEKILVCVEICKGYVSICSHTIRRHILTLIEANFIALPNKKSFSYHVTNHINVVTTRYMIELYRITTQKLTLIIYLDYCLFTYSITILFLILSHILI